jgi:hypothetical protein
VELVLFERSITQRLGRINTRTAGLIPWKLGGTEGIALKEERRDEPNEQQGPKSEGVNTFKGVN